MSDMILFKDPERRHVLERYRNDATMTQILNHAYRVQDEVNRDVREWRQPAEGKVAEVLAWLASRDTRLKDATPYDYRRHARAYAVQLLFKVADPYWTALPLIGSIFLGDRWSKDEHIDYWRAVAICSAVWEETR